MWACEVVGVRGSAPRRVEELLPPRAVRGPLSSACCAAAKGRCGGGGTSHVGAEKGVAHIYGISAAVCARRGHGERGSKFGLTQVCSACAYIHVHRYTHTYIHARESVCMSIGALDDG